MSINLGEAVIDIQFLDNIYSIITNTNSIQTESGSVSEFLNKSLSDFNITAQILKQTNNVISNYDLQYNSQPSALLGGRLRINYKEADVRYVPAMNTTTFIFNPTGYKTLASLLAAKLIDQSLEDIGDEYYVSSVDIQLGEIEPAAGGQFIWKNTIATTTISFMSIAEQAPDGRSVVANATFFYTSDVEVIPAAERLINNKSLPSNSWVDTIPANQKRYLWMTTATMFSDDNNYIATGKINFYGSQDDDREITYTEPSQISYLSMNNKFVYHNDNNYYLGDDDAKRIVFGEDKITHEVGPTNYKASEYSTRELKLLNGMLIIQESTDGVFIYTGGANS